MSDGMYEYWLCQIKHLRRRTILQLHQVFGDARTVYEATEGQLGQCQFLTEHERGLLLLGKKDTGWKKQWEQIGKRGVRMITWFHKQYPEKLRHIYRPPKCLYVKGRLPDESRITLGIVGARDCTVYGRDMARMFGYRLAEQGVQVISGMAKGIDGWSHQGALEAGADTFAVLGTGVEVCYPTSHQTLYQSIQKHGGLISEFPLFMKASPQSFPQRNRIISGLSEGLLIVEARERSGSLITADAALEQGKDVFVIPGRIGDELSVGCNRLIRQGAIPVLSPQDILEYYKIEVRECRKNESEQEKHLLACIQTKPMHIDSIVAMTGILPTEVMKSLIRLRQRKEIEEVGRDYYRKKL